jgi:hypothetical protein
VQHQSNLHQISISMKEVYCDFISLGCHRGAIRRLILPLREPTPAPSTSVRRHRCR